MCQRLVWRRRGGLRRGCSRDINGIPAGIPRSRRHLVVQALDQILALVDELALELIEMGQVEEGLVVGVPEGYVRKWLSR